MVSTTTPPGAIQQQPPPPQLRPSSSSAAAAAMQEKTAGVASTSQSSPSNRSATHLPLHQDGAPVRTPTAADKMRRLLQVREAGESGRRGVHPVHFLRIAFMSSNRVSRAVNVLWPVVPAAIAVRFATPDNHLAIFILSYLAMVPCANLLGFAGQELSRKVPHVMGVLTETTLGSLVEIILFMVLITRPGDDGVDYTQVIKAAILGSILATMLLCLGLCFIVGGLTRHESTFDAAVSEAGTGLLLTAGFGLAIPTVFAHSLKGRFEEPLLDRKVLDISRSSAILLMVSYIVFVYFQSHTHHGIFDAVFIEDEMRDEDEHLERQHHRLTLTEVLIALVVSIGLVAIMAVVLVQQIHYLVTDRHVSDAFVGLILVPLVEKAAEHLTAVDEAYDNQMNFALSHVLGATLQTALFNGPLVVIVGWGLGKPMGLDFEVFDLAVLLLAILTVGNFLRDQKTNYLEGVLCVIVYVAIAVAALYYPSPPHVAAGEATGAAGAEHH